MTKSRLFLAFYSKNKSTSLVLVFFFSFTITFSSPLCVLPRCHDFFYFDLCVFSPPMFSSIYILGDYFFSCHCFLLPHYHLLLRLLIFSICPSRLLFLFNHHHSFVWNNFSIISRDVLNQDQLKV